MRLPALPGLARRGLGFRVAAFEGYGVYGLRVRGYDSVFRASGCQIWEFPKKTGYLILGPL